MKRLHVTIEGLSGCIEIVYRDNGALRSFDFDFDMDEKATKWIIDRIPLSFAMPDFAGTKKKFTIIEVPEQITFIMFWDKYNDKINSSKKRSEAAWDRLSKAKQVRAYRFIDVAFANMFNGQRKKLAEKYLTDENWNN